MQSRERQNWGHTEADGCLSYLQPEELAMCAPQPLPSGSLTRLTLSLKEKTLMFSQSLEQG